MHLGGLFAYNQVQSQWFVSLLLGASSDSMSHHDHHLPASTFPSSASVAAALNIVKSPRLQRAD